MVRFCIALADGLLSGKSGNTDLKRLLEIVRTADSLRFDSAWVTEDPDGWDAFAVLGRFSGETTSIRLGPGVVNPFMRHPNLIAASVSTLDRLSNGRAFLGLGRGQTEWYRHRFAMDTSNPLQRLETTIDLLQQWWQPPHIANSDEPPSVKDWERVVNPALPPPIYIAAVGPRALTLAGCKADGVLFNELAAPKFVAHAVETAKAAASQAGRDPEALSFFVNPATRITNDPEKWLEQKKTFVALIHTLPGMDKLLASDSFDTASIFAEVRRAMRTDEVLAGGGGFSELRQSGDLAKAVRLIPTGLVEEAAAIGSVEPVIEKLQSFVDAGATHLFFDARGIRGREHEIEIVTQRVNSPLQQNSPSS